MPGAASRARVVHFGVVTERPPFELIAPQGDESPLIVEIPHAGLDVPEAFRATMVAPPRSLMRDADLLVDELYSEAASTGASVLVSRVSRYVIDLNRSEADIDPEVVVGARSGPRMNHGLIWRTTSDGDRVQSRPLTRAELEARLDLVHRPYHRALRAELERKRARFGIAVLLAAHSMPSAGRASHGSAGVARADVVPGTRGRTTAAPRFIEAVEAHARTTGWSVRHDDPYPGGFSTQAYGRPSDGIHAVQVELARRLYMREAELDRRPGAFDDVRGWCRALAASLGAAALAAVDEAPARRARGHG
jgi:N-formylglutamate deformylase